MIQRRAAPMPRSSLAVSDSVCRVPKLTSLRTVASMRWAEMLRSIALTSAAVVLAGAAELAGAAPSRHRPRAAIRAVVYVIAAVYRNCEAGTGPFAV